MIELAMGAFLQKLHDSPLIGFCAGLIYGVLTSSGFMIPGHSDAIIQATQAVVGGIIGVVTIVSYFEHKTQSDKIKSLNPQPLPPGVTPPITPAV